MQAIRFLFGFKGRIDRVDFWLLMLTVVAILAAVIILDKAFRIGEWSAILGIAAFTACTVVGLSAITRRLHDRDKSAWYILLFFGVPTALQSFIDRETAGGFSIMLFSGGFGSFIDIVCLAISIWMIVELGFLPGSQGGNAYGASPLSDETAAG